MASIDNLLSLVNRKSGAQKPPGNNVSGAGNSGVTPLNQQPSRGMRDRTQLLQDRLDLSMSGRAINTAANENFPDSVRVDAINQYVRTWNSRFPSQQLQPISVKQFSDNRPAFQKTTKKLAGQLEMFKRGELTGPEFLQIAGTTNQDLVRELQAERPLLRGTGDSGVQGTEPQSQTSNLGFNDLANDVGFLDALAEG